MTSTKAIKKMTCIAIICLFVLSLASCGAVDKSKIVGKYELSRAEGVGISLTKEQIDAMKVLGMTFTFEVKDDGTAFMDVFENQVDFTYDLRKMTFTCDGKDEKFTFDGEKIAFNNEGRKLEFTKIS